MTNSQLKSIVERIEKLEDERVVLAEAKGNGFDVKILRKVVAMRKQDADKRREEQAVIAVYMQELGMLADTPLGRAAIEREMGKRSEPKS